MKYRKKPAVVDAITFDELVAHGLAQDGANIVDGVPWSFTYYGMPFTHETNDHYTFAGLFSIRRGDVLVTDTVVGGSFSVMKPDIFAATYEPFVSPVSSGEAKE